MTGGPGGCQPEAAPAVRVDLHAHTNHSLDATTTPADLVERAAEAGLDRIAVTDHGVIEGALAARELAPGRVIVGEEIRCRCRTELIGLFLPERVPPGLSLEETVERIRGQGGVVLAPHPFAYAWRPAWRARRALESCDAVEAFNARAFLRSWNRAALQAARARGIPAVAGSDAHFPAEIGRAYAEMPSFHDARGFLEAAAHARPVGLATAGPAAHVVSWGLKTVRAAVGLGRSVRELPAPRPAAAEF